MALRLQKRAWKTADGGTSESWRLIVESYTLGKRTDLYPPKEEYARYGLDPDDTYEQAKAKLKVVRAQAKIIERKARISKRVSTEALVESAFLPTELYLRFVAWLTDRRMWHRIPPKAESHLRCMRRLVVELNTDPSEWPSQPEVVYKWFQKNKLSLSYIEKILPLLNDYGYFYCREMKKPYLPVPPPSRLIASRIDDANHDARQGSQEASKPLLPEHLERLKELPPEQLRWLRVSVYFGLRPIEIDGLGNDTTWEATRDENKTWIFHVYQSKLIGVERARRWKHIPCILPEQAELLTEIKLGKPMKRPWPKTLQKHLGPGYGVYGGRKGFEKLMRSYGQKFDNISRWLGHQDPKRTERHYRETEAVEYDPIKR